MVSNREWALLIWLGGGVALLLLRGDTRAALLGVVRSALSPVLAVPVLLMAGWVAGMVSAAVRVRWWEAELAADTVVWFFGTALALIFTATASLGEERFVSQTLLRAVKVTVFVEVFVNLYVFSLALELILLPVLTVLLMLSIAAGSQERFSGVKALFDTLLALIGLALIAYVIFQMVADWQDFDESGALRKFALPVWLTIGVVPFLYVLRLYAAYDADFRRIDWATGDPRQRWRAKLALVMKLHVGRGEIAALNAYWVRQLAAAHSCRDAYGVIDQFKAWRREDQHAEAEAQDRLQRHAGVDGVGEDGLRLDQREFKETKAALRALATAQMGWHRNRGGRYRPELLEILKSRFDRCGLPPEHGISLWVGKDGQSWWAYRRTVSGWCFAVGAAGPPPDEWLYDGPEPPTGPPGRDASWGQRWGADAKNW